MRHDITVSPDEIEDLPPGALASLNHAFRREFERVPTHRDRERIEREHTRRVDDTHGRPWRIVER